MADTIYGEIHELAGELDRMAKGARELSEGHKAKGETELEMWHDGASVAYGKAAARVHEIADFIATLQA